MIQFRTLSGVHNRNVIEAAYTAALVKAPHISRNNERGIQRQNLVIERMREAGAISPAQAGSAQQQPLPLRKVSAPI
jgi:membrane peptidoglycan carboxypeptidase